MDPHASQPVVQAGEPLGRAPVVIMVHGRNAAPANILDLLPRLARPGFTYLAPAAEGRTWYPLSFLAPLDQNEPKLTSALTMLGALVARVERAGVPRSQIVMLGFSQGACLTSEFAFRNASRFGGVIAFTGGLLGPIAPKSKDPAFYRVKGSFAGTPIFMGSSDPDQHVPVERVMESAQLFGRMGAAVTTRIYPGMGHTVSDDEIGCAQAILDEVARVTVLTGPGSLARLSPELDRRGLDRVLVVTTPGRAYEFGPVSELLSPAGGPDRIAAISDVAAMHVPSDRVRKAVESVDHVSPSALVAFGGGSAIGLAKAVALERPLPVIAIPTTYSGSEMTSVWGVTAGDAKKTGRDPRVAPQVVVYDPALTLSLPPHISAASGMNAIAHAVEALYAAGAGPIAAAAAEQAIRVLARALPAILARPDGTSARADAQTGGHLAGVALQHASMGLHHKLCHVLGGTFGLPHAETHAALLPHVVAFNAPSAPTAVARIADALGAADAVAGLHALNRSLGLSATLADLGLKPGDIERAAGLVTSATYPNPRAVTVEGVRAVLEAAMLG